MNEEIKNLESKVIELTEKIDKVYVSVEKTRKYFVMIMWITVLGFILPLIGLVYALPSAMSTYTSGLNLGE
jgi:hypothetical protein